MNEIIYNPPAGSHIKHACQEAVRIAVDEASTVGFDFNGIGVEATPESDPVSLMDEWEAKSRARREAYHNSMEGIEAARKSAEDIATKQRQLNELLAILPGILSDHDALMLWVSEFTDCADRIGVTFEKEPVISLLESAGYQNNHHCGNPPEWFNTRPRMAEYIMGQVINCLKRDMGPHPVAISFAEKYLKLPKA